MNRLADEKSPYLRQHAQNPVDWYPWGEEAFAAARRENKPVFLSIGYATCHWCHVMERESFQDEETARLLNEAFVCVKVDREERPDLDHYYMSVCQLFTGSGGWPLTVLLTPAKEPFFAATYIPRENSHGRMGLKEFVPRILDAWSSNPQGIAATVEKVRDSLSRLTSVPGVSVENGFDLSDSAFSLLEHSYDEDWGGFGGPPKFPSPHQLTFLLRHGRRTGRPNAGAMAARTLEEMSRGGIFDHLGGGFHRYATDREWLLPHFEKMLYDQALLALAYAEGWQALANAEFRVTAERVVDYMLSDLRLQDGGFASAEDADSEGEEGKYYLWTEEEIRRTLKPKEADQVLGHFHLSAGRNTLHLGPHRGSEASGTLTDAARAALLQARRRRIPPFKDTKILTDWNGLAVAALSVCGRAFKNRRYLREAESAADFLRQRMTRPDGGLFHRFMDGQAAVPAFLDDYAFFIWGLIELFQSTFRIEDLTEALRLARRAVEDFWDRERGGFYFAAERDNEVPLRKKEFFDGALPSGNSAMAGNLLVLSRLTADSYWEELFKRHSRVLRAAAAAGPTSFTHYLGIMELTRMPFLEVVVAGVRNAPDTEAFLDALRREYLPGKAILLRTESPETEKLLEAAPFLEPYRMIEGRAAAYICSGFRCQAPSTSPQEMLRLLRSESL